jgi:beta-glucosidase
MGYSPLMESEEGDALLSEDQGDRPDIGLPPAQVDFVKKLAAGGARIVLVLFGGGPIALGELEALVDVVVFVWYPGQAGGQALADILFGNESPSGKLPVTFPQSTGQLPPFDDYRMEGRTYRFSRFEPLYPFGFGLSYTRFAYQDLKLNRLGPPGEIGLSFSVTLKNTGEMDGEEVVQIYLSGMDVPAPRPRHTLVSFRRVKVKAGQSKKVSFTLPREAFLTVDESGDFRLETGPVRLTVGGCSPGPRGSALGAPTPLTELINLNA